MSLAASVTLWVSSLSLASFGLVFSVLASRNSRKAYLQIKELISSSWVSQESEKFFFDKVKKLITANQVTINKLVSNKDSKLSYYDYSVLSSQTRLAPISSLTFEVLKKTKYKDLSLKYLSQKEFLDKKFTEHFGSFHKLRHHLPMTTPKRNQMVQYHEMVIKNLKSIIEDYSDIVSRGIQEKKESKVL